MAMRKTLLEMVQTILSDMDSEPVNAISDTNEADQIVTIIEQAFYDIIAFRDDIPEQYGFLKLTPLSDLDFPTHFHYPARVTNIQKVWYDKSTDGTFDYAEVTWCDPLEFVQRLDRVQSDYTSVKDKLGNINLRIVNNKFPEYYTSFDDYHIVMNSWMSTIDDTLIEAKVRAFGRSFPDFDRSDNFAFPDFDDEYHTYLIAEARSRAFDWFKGGTTTKAEQAARRAKVHIQNDKHRTQQQNHWTAYGR